MFDQLMNQLIQQATAASELTGDVPVAAALVDGDNNIVSTGVNNREATGDSTGHAEIVAIREASLARNNWNLEDLTLVVTLEPCVMCAGAIRAARIKKVVFGAWDALAGASGSAYDILRDPRLGKPIEVIAGIQETANEQLLKEFFKRQR